MKTRIFTSIVALLVFIPVIILSDTCVFPIAVALCAALSVFELLRCCGLHKNWVLSVPMLLIAVVLPASVCFIENFEQLLTYALPLLIFMTLYCLAIMVFSKGKIGIEDVSVASFTTFYIVFAYLSILFLRYYVPNGKYLYLLVFVGAWITDIFAYFCGMLFGKHKLIPEVSPKKTIEGSIGGILFCGLAFVAYGAILKYAFADAKLNVNLILFFVFGIAASLVSQIGDLSMSAIKRKYNVKDYGNIFPGHGGMLDRFDSILAVATVLFILNNQFHIV